MESVLASVPDELSDGDYFEAANTALDLLLFISEERGSHSALGGRRDLMDRVSRLLETLGVEPSQCRSVERLFEGRKPTREAAWFPVEIVGGSVAGAVRRIHVGPRRDEDLDFRPTDREFVEAVERGRKALWLGTAGQEHVQHFRWWIEPVLPSNQELKGGSVAMAAAIAWASAALHRDVPDDMIFTGVWHDQNPDEFKEPDGLTAKRSAVVREFSPHARACCPHGKNPSNAEVDGWSDVRELERLLPRVFGHPLRTIEEWLPRSPVRELPPNYTETERTQHLRLRTILAVSPRPLPQRTIEELLRAWDPHALDGVLLDGLLRSLQVAPATPDGRWHLAAETGTNATDREKAHALFVAALADQDRAQDRERGLEATDAVYHLAGLPQRALEAAQLLRDELQRHPNAVGAAIRQLEIIESRIKSPHAGCPSDAVAQALASEQAGLSVRLVSLAWSMRNSPPPFRGLFERLKDCSTPVQRVLWLQSAVETALHLGAGLAVFATTPPGADEKSFRSVRGEELAQRPTLGLLAFAAWSLKRLRGLSGELETWRRAWCDALPSDDLQRAIAAPFNEVLHGFGTWDRWLDPSSASAMEDRLCGSLPLLIGVIRAAVTLLERHPAVADTLIQGGLAIRGIGPTGEVWLAFPRGVFKGRVRYWDLASSAAWSAPLPTGVTAVDALRNEATRSAVCASRCAVEHPGSAGELDISRLVSRVATPMASGLKRLKTAIDVRDLLGALAGLDVVIASLLRLAFFAVQGDVDLRQESVITVIHHMTKRKLWDFLSSEDRDGRQGRPVVEAVRSSKLGEVVPGAIDLLEQLEHSCWDTADALSRVRGCALALADALASSPWLDRLIPRARDASGNTWAFVGPAPRPSTSAVAPLESAVVLGDGAAAWRLGGFARIEPRENRGPLLFLLGEVTSRNSPLPMRRYALTERGSLEWRNEPYRGLGIELTRSRSDRRALLKTALSHLQALWRELGFSTTLSDDRLEDLAGRCAHWLSTYATWRALAIRRDQELVEPAQRRLRELLVAPTLKDRAEMLRVVAEGIGEGGGALRDLADATERVASATAESSEDGLLEEALRSLIETAVRALDLVAVRSAASPPRPTPMIAEGPLVLSHRSDTNSPFYWTDPLADATMPSNVSALIGPLLSHLG